ncbi:MAG: helix-turn-helix transcriptional regulator [Pseudomonadota bacterium]
MHKLSHEAVWTAIDRLAERYKLSPSGLARRAGLDATIFNKSKRQAANGRERWPSTESIAKIIEATGSSVDEFMTLILERQLPRDSAVSPPMSSSLPSPMLQPLSSPKGNLSDDHPNQPSIGMLPTPKAVPLIGFAEAGTGGYFTPSGFPTGHGWDEVSLPDAGDEGAYALEVSGNSMLPLYRHGDVLVVSATATVQRGDRVVARTLDGEVMVKVLARKTDRFIELESLNPEFENRQFKLTQIDWMHRILWVRH